MDKSILFIHVLLRAELSFFFNLSCADSLLLDPLYADDSDDKPCINKKTNSCEEWD